MTLDEAIKYCEDEAVRQEDIANSAKRLGVSRESIEHCKQCVVMHRQLAEWLRELKKLREENKVLTSECDRLIKEKGELLSKVGGGEICQLEEQIRDWKEEYAYINKLSYGYYKEPKEAKRLLKSAIEDLNATAAEVYNGGVICKCCKWESQIGKCSCPDDGGCDTDYQWRYADEALKLIGDEPNV